LAQAKSAFLPSRLPTALCCGYVATMAPLSQSPRTPPSSPTSSTSTLPSPRRSHKFNDLAARVRILEKHKYEGDKVHIECKHNEYDCLEDDLVQIKVPRCIADRLTALSPALLAQKLNAKECGKNVHSSRLVADPVTHLRANVAKHAGFQSDVDICSLSPRSLRSLQRSRPVSSPNDAIHSSFSNTSSASSATYQSNSSSFSSTSPRGHSRDLLHEAECSYFNLFGDEDDDALHDLVVQTSPQKMLDIVTQTALSEVVSELQLRTLALAEKYDDLLDPLADAVTDCFDPAYLPMVEVPNASETADHLRVLDCRVKVIKFEFACQVATGVMAEDHIPYDMVASMILPTPTDDCDEFLFSGSLHFGFLDKMKWLTQLSPFLELTNEIKYEVSLDALSDKYFQCGLTQRDARECLLDVGFAREASWSVWEFLCALTSSGR